MKTDPLYIAFLWHMHQPCYMEPKGGEMALPWVRLHGTKDYLDMLEILEEYPDIRQTFNFSGSLLEQIKAYSEGKGDRFLRLSLKRACDLTREERLFILRHFFTANFENMLKPYPRYFGLYLMRGEGEIDLRRFSTQDFLDLQVWFNLVWIDPIYRKEIDAFIKKGADFTEEEKLKVLDFGLGILKRIIPAYKKAQGRGQIELSASPYYHPILPLLCDSDSAREAMREAELPERFRHPEDARWQIDESMRLFTKMFGAPPCGMWPSEGAVSEELVPILIDAGIKWVAADEEILFRSVIRMMPHRAIYRPYLLQRHSGNFKIVFRDRPLSDMISFVYHRQDADIAVSDFMMHLQAIKNSLSKFEGANLVTIIMDGENAWEYYKNDGGDFLRLLYRVLSEDANFKTTTISQFLEDHPPHHNIVRLFSGSWINANFNVWIGSAAKNLAWEALRMAREELGASKELYIAEGSDWFWWYDAERTCAYNEEFDTLFRNHLKYAYEACGKKVPRILKEPIRKNVSIRQPI